MLVLILVETNRSQAPKLGDKAVIANIQAVSQVVGYLLSENK